MKRNTLKIAAAAGLVTAEDRRTPHLRDTRVPCYLAC
jgi:hypothetical protein